MEGIIVTTTTGQIEQERDALVEHLLQATFGAWDIFTTYIGERLGLYDALALAGPLTSGELASRTGTQERYVREWLEQQTVSGILSTENPGDGPKERRFSVPAGHVEVLTDRESTNYLAALPQIVAGAVFPIGAVLNAFRQGGGVPYIDYGPDLREGQAGMNRAAFLHLLGTEWLPSIPDIHARLQADSPARVADIGCGFGWSSIGIARSYPNVFVDGYDLDGPSVEQAQRNVRGAGLTERVTIQARDAGEASLDGHYDLVTAFECVHDMSDPVSVLATMRRLAGDSGAVLIMDERVQETFTPDGNDVERFMYGFSVLHCLPVGMADQPSVGTGTVMRPDTLRSYAQQAGYREVEILPIDNFFFSFYRLWP